LWRVIRIWREVQGEPVRPKRKRRAKRKGAVWRSIRSWGEDQQKRTWCRASL
jgi:hypothetical protein